MEDGKIIFRARMPGDAIDLRIFENINDFHDAIRAENNIWREFPSFGKGGWDPSASYIQFKELVTQSAHSPEEIEKATDRYYSEHGGSPLCFYPSWTLAGKIIYPHKDNTDYLDGFATGFRNEPTLVLNTDFSGRKLSISWLQGLAAAQIVRNGLSTSSSENAMEEMRIIRDRHAQLMNEARERKSHLEDVYNKQLQIEAAVTYWGSKASEHEDEKKFWMKSIVAWSTLSLILLAAYLGYGKLFFTETIKVFNMEEPWAFVCGFLILASFVYWVIRFVVSQYNQHNNLATDARERETMAKTFLALITNESSKETVTKESHLGIVLAALFRPSAIGGCENGPVPFYEVLGNMLSKK